MPPFLVPERPPRANSGTHPVTAAVSLGCIFLETNFAAMLWYGAIFVIDAITVVAAVKA
jgi:hypothetical protein